MKIADQLKIIILDSVEAKVDPKEVKIEHPNDNQFGDYSTNIALIMAKKLKQNPRKLAEEMQGQINDYVLKNKIDLIEKVEMAGAGFINFYLNPSYLIEEAEIINYDIEFRRKLAQNFEGKTMVIDYSAPNIAKPFGIGHLRSTNIGQSIYNIYKILGWRCIGDNHIGDWGTQYGKLMAAIVHAMNNDSRFIIGESKLNLDKITIDDLENLYVKFHKEAEKDENLAEEGRQWFAKLEQGDKEAKKIWQKCVDISLREFERVYQMLGVKIDFVHGESFYQDMISGVTKEIEGKKITKKSQGAVIVELKGMPPAMLEKSNGTTTYFARDMAAIKYRKEKWNPDLIIYEVGSDQQLHFRQVFAAAELMGWFNQDQLVHVAHGLIRWPTGKFSTRKGDTIHLSTVMEKAMAEAKKIADKSEVDKKLTATEKEEMIKTVAIGAVKFSDLVSDPKKDIIFDWDKVMSLEGDSGPYLQYTYARCKSVLNKTKIKEQKNISRVSGKINNEEMSLVKEFYKFEEKIIEAAERFSPSVVAEYILGIARKYNEFYAKNWIINQKEEVFRVFLTRTAASIIETGLDLLGIETVEKM
ncbi:MAG TPA: arginine--tRNA ligase [bacterium]|nr:arginine--tRNA ligase [Candidatus Woesebacteria bacterium]HOG37505.1 arginine--tRNA ligase [Candidatus Woesebacteria bacterium]HPL01556.1 arginine--tRNA ligase [bacterium]